MLSLRRPWGRRARRELLYADHLRTVDQERPAGQSPGPNEAELGRGRAEFLGRTRVKSLRWRELPPQEMLGLIESYWVCFLRTAESQVSLGSSHDEFSFDTADELHAFLGPLDVQWFGAVETAELLESHDLSPDWTPSTPPTPR
ncbi:hypothetical protein DWB68_08050 [Galactobacter valiniphilus]|uniref:Uncharacterized protein n=1 Tax=Galactobacter valiniphilus TaxID=2676122 RepID=A0A399JAS4_9MICC|nr:hypothetical protein [Galactobacter valiniphilus]RII42334.1 hypothetical protein DWB68_08050 [Galactobacter valiniphilus]